MLPPRRGKAKTTDFYLILQASQESASLSLREIQEIEEQRKMLEASQRKKSSQGNSEPITKLLWETRISSGIEPIPLTEIMAQVILCI